MKGFNIRQTLKNFDFFMLFAVLITVFFGMVIIFSATNNYGNQLRFILVQFAALAIGLVVMMIIMTFDYDVFSEFPVQIFIFNILLLVLVLILGTGLEETGSKSWIILGPVSFQPSEIAKICFVLSLGGHLNKIKENVNEIRNIIMLLLHLCIPLALILLQPDLGTALVYIVIFLGMTFIAGVSWKYYFFAICSFLVSLPIFWYFLKDYQKKRIITFFNPESDPLDAGYQVIQSKIALGSGGLFGKGYLHGAQTQLGILPAKHTDFIFAVVGEELGFIGCLFITVMLFLIISRCVYIGFTSKTDYGTLIAIGVTSMFLFHTFENIGMCIGLMPVTGIPLTFVSYGGSAIITNFAALALVMNVKYRNKYINF